MNSDIISRPSAPGEEASSFAAPAAAMAGDGDGEAGAGVALSIVVCTYQRPVLLAGCLRSCLRQISPAHRWFEIIVVDNDSARSAAPIVAALPPAASSRIRYVNEPRANIALARNRGVREAQGDIIAFIDDDFVVPQGWLAAVLAQMEETGADVILGDVRPIFEGIGPSRGIAEAFTRNAPEAEGRVPVRADGYIPGARSGNAILRRHCFAAGDDWFDPAFGRSGGEDSEFFLRLGRRRPHIQRSAKAFVLDYVPRGRQSEEYVFARARREGRNYARLMLKHSRHKALRAADLIARGVLQAMFYSLLLAGGRWLTRERRLDAGIRRGLALGKAMLAGAARDVPYR